MKLKINNENKVKFFALYFGQKIFVNPMLSIEPVKNIYLFDDDTPEDIYWEYLLLKPLSKISDDDAASVCRLFSSYFPDDSVAAVQGRILVSEYIRRTSNLTAHDWFLALDYLRSKSYALPWMGLSVEEMVEAGWIKLLDK